MKTDGTITSIIEAAVDYIPRAFRPDLYVNRYVYITDGDAKGFLCEILKVHRVSPSVALQRPLDSGLLFSVDHPAAAVKKLLENVPYEHIIDAEFVPLTIAYFASLTPV
jgi:hypothetical protein